MKPLIDELTTLLNGYSEENESNTPDFMLAKFMLSCLEAFNVATRERDRWYGVHLEPGNKYFKKDAHGDEMTPAGQRWTRKRNKQSLLASVAPMVARDLAPLYKHMCSKAKEKPMFSNELTPAENERLALLAEEMGEAIQAIGKILRHGYESTGPKTIVRNRTSLEKELGDVRLAISMMVDSGDLSSVNLKDFEEDKRRRVGQYLHHNTLTPNEATE